MQVLKIHTRKGERGTVLALTAIALLSLLLAVGLCVDVGHWYVVNTELQNAADAAALAGAADLDFTADGLDRALTSATTIVNNYEFQKTQVVIPPDNVKFAVNLDGTYYTRASVPVGDIPNIRFVQVTTQASQTPVFFSVVAVYQGGIKNIAAQAVAGRSVATNLYCNLSPLSTVECDPQADPTPTPCPGETEPPPPCRLLNAGTCPANVLTPHPTTGVPVVAVKDQNGQPVYENGQQVYCDPAREYCQQCTYIVRAAPNGQGNTCGGPAPGNFNILRLDGTGGDVVREGLASNYNKCLTSDACNDTQPGVEAGPVAQGINTAFNNYNGFGNPTAARTNYPPDKNVKAGIDWAKYKAARTNPIENGSNANFQAPKQGNTIIPGLDGRRIMLVPKVKYSDFQAGGGGVNRVCFSGIAAFFVQEPANNGSGEVKFEYIGDPIQLGLGGIVTGPAPTNPNLTLPVLYK